MFSLFLLPVLGMGQKRTNRKILADMKREITYLSAPKLDNTCIGSPGQGEVSAWLAGQFHNAGLLPGNLKDNYLQVFSIDEGKMAGSGCRLNLNGVNLTGDTSFFPLPYSASMRLKGNPLVSVQEQGSPWIMSVSDLLGRKQANPGYDISDALYDRARQAAADGATAVIFYSANAGDDRNLGFDPNDHHTPLSIPIVYVRSQAAQKSFGDDSGSVSLDMAVSIDEKKENGFNVEGDINNHAENTVIIAANYDHAGHENNNDQGLTVLLELARMLKAGPDTRNNYLFLAFTGKGEGMTGADHYLAQPGIDQKRLNFAVDLDLHDGALNTAGMVISGTESSPAWPEIFSRLKYPGLVWNGPGTDTASPLRLVISRLQIPVISFSTRLVKPGGEKPNNADKDWLKQLRVIYTAISDAASRGKLVYSSPAQ